MYLEGTMKKFRLLKTSEIDCRVSTINQKGCSLLLYKDARVDQNILDETVGPMNWKREHALVGDSFTCTVSIWDGNKNQWISKQDVGTESYTEAQKGQASDSFKRACFNWGIGRELYTAPFVWVPADKAGVYAGNNGRYLTNERFYVSEINYDDNRNIIGLEICSKKGPVYTYGKVLRTDVSDDTVYDDTRISRDDAKAFERKLEDAGIDPAYILTCYRVECLDEMTKAQMGQVIHHMDRCKEKYLEWLKK